MTRSCHTTQFGCFELVGEGLAWHALKRGGGGYQDEGGGDDDGDVGESGGDVNDNDDDDVSDGVVIKRYVFKSLSNYQKCVSGTWCLCVSAEGAAASKTCDKSAI